MRNYGSFRFLIASAHFGVLATTGCASSGQPPRALELLDVARVSGSSERSTDGLPVITSEQLALTHATTTLESLRLIRPDFLRVSPRAVLGRPVELSLFVDGSYSGDVSLLNLIPISQIRTIRFLHPTDAAGHFGSFCKCEGGVLAVTMRRASDGR